MIEEATVDCYNEDEQVTGLFTMIEDNLALPFETTVLGMAVSVASVDAMIAKRTETNPDLRPWSKRPLPLVRSVGRSSRPRTRARPTSR